MRSVVVVLLLCCFTSGFSQIVIDGTIEDPNGHVVADANVTILAQGTENILAYDISDEEGQFSITIDSPQDDFDLKVRSMGYKTEIKTIANKAQTLALSLKEEITELREVSLKSQPITRQGDTLNYGVSAFSKQKDRTIGDVLEHMPGFEVLSNGKILYQGRAINKYYIQGLDLLGGRYNLANKNLPYKEVSQVQVLENHQPIKLLDSVVFSNQAAVNIKLKNDYTFTGQVEIGSGGAPLLWDVNLTPMLFSDSTQVLTSYQANNVGNDGASQLKKLTAEDLVEQFERNDEKDDWLGIQKLREPGFTEKRWLDNNVHLITTNFLHQLKNDYEIRLNLSYLNDYQQQNGFTKTRFFTGTDTIGLTENTYNQLYTNSLKGNLTLKKNTDENYLKNKLQFQGHWDSQRGQIETNTTDIRQHLKNHYFKLSNDLKSLFRMGKQIAMLKSYIGIQKTPQNLAIQPGQFDEALNNGDSYDEVEQDLELNTFYTNNSLGLTKGWNRFSFSPKLGIQYEKQKLESQILTLTGVPDSDFENNLNWTRSKLYFHLKSQYKRNSWRLELKTPVNMHHYKLTDQPLEEEQKRDRVTFEPHLAFKYEMSHFWRIRATAGVSNRFGTIDQVYFNYILRNYRNIQRIDAPLPEKKRTNYSLSFRYKNPLRAEFLSLRYAYRTTKNNVLYNTSILNSGATQLEAIEKTNTRRSHNLSGRISKILSSLQTSLTLNVNYSLQDFKQILNDEVTDISNQNWRIAGKIDADITDWLNAELKPNFQISNNKIQDKRHQTITQQSHKFDLNIYPKDNQILRLKTEYIRNNTFSSGAENLFADLLYRYTWESKGIDFEVQWTNIFNTKNYRTVSVDNFSYLESNYELRPSQVLFTVKFSL